MTTAGTSPARPDPRSVDLPRYCTLLQRAIQTVLAPIQQAVPGGLISASPALLPLQLPHPAIQVPDLSGR